VRSDGQLDYRPTARRPIAGLFRRTAESAVRLCLRAGIHADAVSYGSIVASAAAALLFWQSGQAAWLLVPAAVLCYVRLWLNMLDGMVALASGKASLRGEILNDFPDRISDVLIFVGAAHSGLCHPASGYWVAILALLTAYSGTLGQAVGVQREFSGTMSKPSPTTWRPTVAAASSGGIRFAATSAPRRPGKALSAAWPYRWCCPGCCGSPFHISGLWN
jgi:phosphatidylglycerophosphate synthase